MGSVGNHRTALALGLTVLAVVFPCAAWYLVGSREVARQVTEVTARTDQDARATAERLAIQITQRLNALRDAEAQRPYYHYQPYFHDPEGAAEGAAVVPSPLSTAPRDPLIQNYFQVDAHSGDVTFPTAEAELKQIAQPQLRHQHADDQRFLRRQLEAGLNSITLRVRGESQPAPQAKASLGQRVEVLPKDAYAQNLEATDIYRNIKNAAAQNAQPRAPVFTNSIGDVQVFVGPLKWRTVYVADEPSLVALREVTLPGRAVLQGFLLAAAGLSNLCQITDLPARFQLGPPTGNDDVALNLDAAVWHISVNAAEMRSTARRQAREVYRSFWTMFLGGVGVAALAGLGVVWIVWQTERLARQRSQFAASAAHELRTPLAGLRLYSDMLADGLGDPGKTHAYAQRVADESERLGRIVTNVLGFTRLERGTLKVQAGTGDLIGFVRECVTRQQPALEAAGVRLDVVMASDLPAVKFDPDAIAQILQNLLDNAEKHTRHASNRTITVALATGTDGTVELSVLDHGPGVPEQIRRHLFEAFQRGNQPDAPAGIGLGLVLVKALAEAQGATVAYTDNAGGGARFTVTLPT